MDVVYAGSSIEDGLIGSIIVGLNTYVFGVYILDAF